MGQRIDLTQQVQGILPETNGGAGPNIGLRFADAETPSGAVNGVNSTFALAHAPNPGLSILWFLNKQIQLQGIDYTLSGSTLTTTVPPVSGATSFAWYRYLAFNFGLSFSDGLSLSDNFGLDAPVSQIPMSVQDQLSQSDFLLFTLSPVLFMDTLVMSDSFSFALAVLVPLTKSFSDTNTFGLLNLKDAFASRIGRVVIASDTLTMTDSFAKTLA